MIVRTRGALVAPLLFILPMLTACTERSGNVRPGSARKTATKPSKKRQTSHVKHVKDMTKLEYWQRRIKFFSGRIKAAPKQHVFYGPLAGAYQRLASIKAELWPHKKAIELCETAIKMGGLKVRFKLQAASSYAALHRLKEARQALKLVSPGTKLKVVLPLQAEMALQVGNYKLARQKLVLLAKQKGATGNAEGLLGVLEDTLGNHKKALAHWQSALGALEGVKRGRAWIRVMRGLSYLHRGRFSEARDDFREAVRLAPAYVLAVEHLGEAEFRLGKLERSIAIYQGVIGLSKNPEYHAAIAEVFRKKGDTTAAKRHEAIAAERYAQWLREFPKAAAGHAVDFYLGAGNKPGKAAELARKDAELRPSSAAHVALATALLATGDMAGARAAIDKALAMQAKNAELYWVAGQVYGKAKDGKTRAAGYRKQALAINPHQASM